MNSFTPGFYYFVYNQWVDSPFHFCKWMICPNAESYSIYSINCMNINFKRTTVILFSNSYVNTLVEWNDSPTEKSYQLNQRAARHSWFIIVDERIRYRWCFYIVFVFLFWLLSVCEFSYVWIARSEYTYSMASFIRSSMFLFVSIRATHIWMGCAVVIVQNKCCYQFGLRLIC